MATTWASTTPTTNEPSGWKWRLGEEVWVRTGTRGKGERIATIVSVAFVDTAGIRRVPVQWEATMLFENVRETSTTGKLLRVGQTRLQHRQAQQSADVEEEENQERDESTMLCNQLATVHSIRASGDESTTQRNIFMEQQQTEKMGNPDAETEQGVNTNNHAAQLSDPVVRDEPCDNRLGRPMKKQKSGLAEKTIRWKAPLSQVNQTTTQSHSSHTTTVPPMRAMPENAPEDSGRNEPNDFGVLHGSPNLSNTNLQEKPKTIVIIDLCEDDE